MRAFSIVLLLMTYPGFGQTARPKGPAKPVVAKPVAEKPADPAKAWPVGSLDVEGNRIYSTAQVLAAAELKLGQMAGKEEFEAARDRILATGAFESVGYKFGPAASGAKQFAASFQVVEIQQVFPYRFEAITGDEAALRAWLKQKEPLFEKTVPATKEILARMAKASEEFLAKSGHPETISGRLVGEGKKELVVVFGPSQLPAVAEVKFKGNEAITQTVLQQTIAGVAVGSIYTPARFQELLDNGIRPLYEAKGKIRVSFAKLDTEPAKEVDGLIVTVNVVEGATYKLGEVTLTGAPGAPTLLKEAKFTKGEPANFTAISEGVERILAIQRRAGYMQVKADTERKIDDKEKKVDLVLHVERGPLFSFGKLAVQGLDIQSEPQIRKLWAMKVGAPFNKEYPDFFLNRLREDGYFDNLGKTTAKLNVDDKNNIVDVTLVFSSDGKAPPAIGPERDAQEKRERQQKPPE